MLRITTHEPKQAIWWYYQFLEGKIDLSPSYQRRSSIWSKWKQAHLIDSLINGFDVPKFYFGNFLEMPASRLPDKINAAYSVIDGKQRLGAVFSFFSNSLKINNSSIFEDDPKLKIQGLGYSELKSKFPAIAERIESFVPAIMSVQTDDVRKIEELFIRLNMGEAANGAEQRNAMGGPVPELIRELSLHPFFTKKIKFSTARMQEFNLIAKLLYLEHEQRFVDTKKSDLDRFAKTALEKAKSSPDQNFLLEDGEYVEAKDRVLSVLEILAPEFEEKDPLLASSGNIPVYYWWARSNRKFVNDLHGFLTELTAAVKEARLDQKVGNRTDSRLLSYYTASRTTNDSKSLELRLKLMDDLYKVWKDPIHKKHVFS